MVEKEFLFDWSNSQEKVRGKNYIDASRKIKTPIEKIEVGILVRVKQTTFNNDKRKNCCWGYWDSRVFLKNVAKGQKKILSIKRIEEIEEQARL